jgi:predicted RNase H-like nuclease
MSIAIGIDGCKGGWFFFCSDDGAWRFGVEESIADILSDVQGGAQVLVDIPIGLKERGKTERECDLAARELLRPKRHSSVFPAPCRQALNMDNYESASEKNLKVTGRKLSRQTWGLVPKIREVDDLMRSYSQAKYVVREAHPELLFCGLAGGPMGCRMLFFAYNGIRCRFAGVWPTNTSRRCGSIVTWVWMKWP